MSILTLLVKPIPAKRRLRATLAEMDRLVDSMPDGMCEVLERTGLVSSWREQIATLAHGASRLTSVMDVLRTARQVAAAVAKRR